MTGRLLALFVVGCGLVTACGENADVAREDAAPVSSPSTASPPPCGGASWAGLMDISKAPAYPTVEEAVIARAGDGYEVVDVRTDPRSGMTWASVLDPWGRTGDYELSRWRDSWIITAGSGCAAV